MIMQYNHSLLIEQNLPLNLVSLTPGVKVYARRQHQWALPAPTLPVLHSTHLHLSSHPVLPQPHSHSVTQPACKGTHPVLLETAGKEESAWVRCSWHSSILRNSTPGPVTPSTQCPSASTAQSGPRNEFLVSWLISQFAPRLCCVSCQTLWVSQFRTNGDADGHKQ